LRKRCRPSASGEAEAADEAVEVVAFSRCAIGLTPASRAAFSLWRKKTFFVAKKTAPLP
jgi:hypothetical protein